MSQIIFLAILIICKVGLYFFLYLVNPYLMYALACIHIASFSEYLHKRTVRHQAFEEAFKELKAQQADKQAQKLDELYGRNGAEESEVDNNSK